MLRIVDGPIDVAAVRAAVDAPRFGAVLVFEGVGRNSFEGRPVVGLSYEAWAPVAERELQRMAEEAQERWPGAALAIVHRTGAVAIGEPSVVVAVGAPHRAEAYELSRWAIDTLKQRLPVWKKEHYPDGASWIANST